MPTLIGMDYNDAVNLWGHMLQFQEDGSEYNEAAVGTIISQSIEPDSAFNKGDKVKVKISKGMQTVEMPDCSNMNQEIAKDQLTQRGLQVEIRNSSSTDIQKGYVIRTEPGAHEEVHVGSTVLLYVSMGKEAGQVKVGNYVGMKAADAVKKVEYLGLKCKTELVASYEDEGKVVKQSIENGEKVEEGTEMVLQVSNGKIPDGEVTYSLYLPEDAVGRFAIDFLLKKEDGTLQSVPACNVFCPDMSSCSTTVKGSGENVYVTVILTNLSNNGRSNIGTYWFNFATGSFSIADYEDVRSAFSQVGGFVVTTDPPQQQEQQATEAPQQQTTENPYQPGVNGDYVDGVWKEYIVKGNGDFRNGVWDWYKVGENGAWTGEGGTWEWSY